MRKACLQLLCSLVLVLSSSQAWAQLEINSSPNVVGSGARALGMGSAFIAIADDATEGFVRFRVHAKNDTILGASIVGHGAGNLISEITLAMQSNTGLSSLANVIHPYPTTAEVIRQSGDLYNRTKLTGTVKRVLRGVVRVQR